MTVCYSDMWGGARVGRGKAGVGIGGGGVGHRLVSDNL